jgi:hypothetical protein
MRKVIIIFSHVYTQELIVIKTTIFLNILKRTRTESDKIIKLIFDTKNRLFLHTE